MSTAADQNAIDAPLNPRCATRTLALTTSDDTATLTPGAYELFLDAAGPCVIGLDTTTTSLPSTSLAAGLGVGVIPAGGVLTIVIEGTTLHARMIAATGTLYIVAKAAL